MTLGQALEKAFLELKDISNGSQKINYLAQEIFSLSYTDLILNKSEILDTDLIKIFEKAIIAVKSKKPEAYILGYQYFCNLKFKVNNSVLIPRPETEQLVEMAVMLSEKYFKNKINFIDLGCGSGCVGVSVLSRLNNAKAILLDISPDAIAVSKENAKILLKDQPLFINSSAELYSPQDKLHLVLGNPPYIKAEDSGVSESTHVFEPHLALYAKEDGLALTRLWMSHYVKFMASEKSFMIFEIGHEQGAAILKHARSLNIFKKVTIVKDLYNKDRFFLGEI